MTNFQGRSFKPVYLDHNATSPLAAELRPLALEWLDRWGNPSSIHQWGRGPKSIMREARNHFSQMIGAHPLEVVFTSGGSEANNQALKSAFFHLSRQGSERRQYLISAVEHPSVMKTMEFLAGLGAEVLTVPVSRQGLLDLDTLRSYLGPKTAMVSVMYANNETGHIFPIKKISEWAHEVGAWVHCDAVQALGKVPVDVKSWGVDLASFSGHKFYSLKGAGALYVRKGFPLESLIHGGGQERGRRAGTENVLAIAALGHMARRRDQVQDQFLRLRALRDQMEKEILSQISGVRVNGPDNLRLPNTSSLILDGVDGETLLMNLDLEGFAVSTGAACSSGNPEPSPVLMAMGLTREEAQSSLRLSLGWDSTEEEVESFVRALKAVVERLRKIKRESTKLEQKQKERL